jgi:type II secretory pathway predicted ATPase ExeA
MKEMIFFRLKQAGYRSHMDLFLEEAFQAIYDYTAGYPRQVTMLCHRVLKELLLKSKMVADAHLVKGLIEEDARSGWQRTNLILQKSNY